MRIVAAYYDGKRISHGWINGAIIRFLGEITDVDFEHFATTETLIKSESYPTLVVYIDVVASTDTVEIPIDAFAKATPVASIPFDFTFLGNGDIQSVANAHTIQIAPLIQNEMGDVDIKTFVNGLRVAVIVTQYTPNQPDVLNCNATARALLIGVIRDCTLQITSAIKMLNTATGTVVQDLNLPKILVDAPIVEVDDIAKPHALRTVATEVHADSAVAESESTAIGNEVTADGSELEYDGEIQTLSVECSATAEINRNAFLTFTGLNSDFTIETENHTKNWDGKLEYSTDLSEWVEWNGTSAIRSENKKLYLSGLNNTFITGDSVDSTKRFVISGDNEIICKGNLLSLLDYNSAVSFDASQNITVAPAAFAYLFYNNANLITAPYMIKSDLSNSDYCYKCTYYGTGVMTIDQTLVHRYEVSTPYYEEFYSGFVFNELSTGCFWSMFEGSKIQKLSDTLVFSTSISNSMGQYSFYRMFANCQDLVEVMRIARLKQLAPYCCASMYENCINLINTLTFSNQSIPMGGYSGGWIIGASHAFDSMFKGCINLVEVSDIDFIQGNEYGAICGTFSEYMCKSMFEGCISLTRIPIVIARYTSALKNYGDHCFDSALKGCTNIKLSTTSNSTYKYEYVVPTKTTGTTYATSLTDMFAGTGGTFTGTPSFGTIYYTEEPSYGYVKVSIYDGDDLYDYGVTPNPYYIQIPTNSSYPTFSTPALSTYLPQKQQYFFDRWNNASGNKMTSIGTKDTNIYIGWSNQADVEFDFDFTDATTLVQQFNFKQTTAYGLSIDWGDGSPIQTPSAINYVNTSHAYPAYSKYTLRVRCNTASSTLPLWEPSLNTASGTSRIYSCVGGYYVSPDSSSNRPNLTLTDIRFLNGKSINFASASSSYTWGDRAIRISNALKTVTFNGSEFKSSGYVTFAECINLSTVNLSNGMIRISNSSFYRCRALQSIDIPYTVTNIDAGAFKDCTSLMSITCRAITPPTLSSDSLSNVPAGCNIYVPAESVNVYKSTTNWSDRAMHIQAIT